MCASLNATIQHHFTLPLSLALALDEVGLPGVGCGWQFSNYGPAALSDIAI